MENNYMTTSSTRSNLIRHDAKRKMPIYVIVSIASLAIGCSDSATTTEHAHGRIESNATGITYINDHFGIGLAIPGDWTVVGNEELLAIAQNVKQQLS